MQPKIRAFLAKFLAALPMNTRQILLNHFLYRLERTSRVMAKQGHHPSDKNQPYAATGLRQSSDPVVPLISWVQMILR
jgi:hypothetical protein